MPYRQALALVTVERDGILHAKPVLELEAEDAWAPNVFVSAPAVRGRSAAARPTTLVDFAKPGFKLGMTGICLDTQGLVRLRLEAGPGEPARPEWFLRGTHSDGRRWQPALPRPEILAPADDGIYAIDPTSPHLRGGCIFRPDTPQPGLTGAWTASRTTAKSAARAGPASARARRPGRRGAGRGPLRGEA